MGAAVDEIRVDLSTIDGVDALVGAKFGLTESRLGLLPAVISPYVVEAIGARQARRWFATAEIFDAEAAFRQPGGRRHHATGTTASLERAVEGHQIRGLGVGQVPPDRGAARAGSGARCRSAAALPGNRPA